MDEQDNIGTFFVRRFCHPAGVDFRWATFPVVALRLPPANGFEAAGFIQPRGRFLFLTSGASRGRCPRLRRSRLSVDSPHNGEQRCFTGLSHIAMLVHSRAHVPSTSTLDIPCSIFDIPINPVFVPGRGSPNLRRFVTRHPLRLN
jgi:hypothetical protein